MKNNEARIERMSVFSEECGEAIQAVGKILRHGIDGQYKNELPNREALEAEIGDIKHAIEMLEQCGDIDPKTVEEYRSRKKEKIKKYLYFDENKI